MNFGGLSGTDLVQLSAILHGKILGLQHWIKKVCLITNPSYNMSNNENKNMQSEKYYTYHLPDEEVVEKVERMRRAVTKNYGMIKLPSLTDSVC